MVELAEIFRRAGPAFLEAFQGRMLPSHRRALLDISRCRTPALGGSVYACDDCGALHYAYHSCRNRHCPKCQEDRAQAWLENLRSRLLPCPHYLLTFTLPAQLRALVRSHQRLGYAILLRQAAAALQTLADDPRWVGGRLAILAVLHTWSRSLAYHPHAHLLVSAGGLSPDGAAWIKPAHSRFLVPGYALSQIFRTKVQQALTTTGLTQNLDPCVWQIPWTVHIQQIGDGRHAAHYLSRYVYRVALSNHRIERFQNGQVTFRYTQAPSGQIRRLTLPVHDFIARFLQHVLPRGFPKIRYYGLLSPSSRPQLQRARHLLESASPRPSSQPNPSPSADVLSNPLASPETPELPQPRICPVCKHGHLHFHAILRRARAPP